MEKNSTTESCDPRVLLAAERTLLAWNRTAISLMAFGFVIERFGLFLEMSNIYKEMAIDRYIAFGVGVFLMVLAILMVVSSIWQYRRVEKTVRPQNIPPGYNLNSGIVASSSVAVTGTALIVYLSCSLIEFF